MAGSVIKKPNNKWELRVSLGYDENNKQRRKTKTVYAKTCNGLGHKIDKKCSACDGLGTVHKQRTLDVKIPAGVEDGTRLRLAGQGEAGTNGGPAGDFYLDIRVRPDKRFVRNAIRIHHR